MYKVAVIGDRDSIYGFAALGLDVFYTETAEDGTAVFKEITSSERYAVVYITEQLASLIMNEIEKYSFKPSPAIILIPGVKGNTGEGIRAVKKSVEKAVGSDILN
ncbi:MAG: V-type ATP synthase subunit F [Ruminococcaceae bacterium]|nr:V-type ATP synthase subunit F [Oscillospiraceae bacterium]